MIALRGWRDSTALQVSFAALALAFVATLWAFVRAVRVEPIPNPPATQIASLDHIRRGTAHPPTDVAAAVDNDLFSIDRSAPAARYRMPGEPDPSARSAPAPEKPLVLGTAVATDGQHFATVQMNNGTPTLVHVGDKIGEWTVRSIERGKVAFVSSGGSRAEVAVSTPGT